MPPFDMIVSQMWLVKVADVTYRSRDRDGRHSRARREQASNENGGLHCGGVEESGSVSGTQKDQGIEAGKMI